MEAISLPNVLRGDLDDTDWRIVQELHRDGRMTYTEIAQRIGVSEPTVRKRVNQLVNSQVIQIAALVNPQGVGLPIDCKIGIRAQKKKLLEVGSQLCAMEEVHYVGYVTGGFDIIIGVYQPTMEGLFHFLRERLDNLDGVDDYEAWTVLRTQKTT